MLLPDLAVGFDDGGRCGIVNAVEEPAAQDLDGFVFFRGVEQRGLAGRDALGLFHLIGDELVFIAIGIGGLAAFADRQRVDHHGVRRAFDRLEQCGEKGRELTARGLAVPCLELAQVDRQLVHQDQRRLAAEQFLDGCCARCSALLVAAAHPLIALPAGEGVGDLAPGRVGAQTRLEEAAVEGVGVLAIEGGDSDLRRREDGRVQELGRIGNAGHAFGGVGQRNQGMRFSAAVFGVQPEDRGDLIRTSGETQTDIAQQVLESAGRVRVREEFDRVEVFLRSVAAQHLGKVSREVRFGDRAPQDVLARRADVEDGRQGHGP